MSTTTPSPTYSSIIPNYSSSPLTQLYSTFTIPSYRDVDRVEVVEALIHNLIPKLSQFIDIVRDCDASLQTCSYRGRLTVAPLATKHAVRNNLYTLDTLPFTEAEINTALRHTYPERFI